LKDFEETGRDKTPARVYEFVISNTKTRGVEVTVYHKDFEVLPHMREEMKEDIIQAHLLKQQGIYMRNTGSFLCSPNGCAFWDECRGGLRAL
jgi:hypothetical protein